MRLLTYFVLISTPLLLLFSSCDSAQYSSDENLASKADSVSYSLGYFYGNGLSTEGVEEIELKNFIAGMLQGLDGEEPSLNDQQMQQLLQQFQQELQANQAQRRDSEAAINAEEAQQFLEENAQKEGVMVTESGLQYRVIEEGTGARPTAESEVEVHYRGTLISGEEFDSSHERNQTATFPLNRVISGWTEGLQLMREGATYEFYIPSELGYGNNPPPGSPIQPGSLLIFEVELINVDSE